MLQALVIERFNMKFHREIKDMPGYALVVAKNGPKFKEAKGEEVNASFGPALKPSRGLVFDVRRPGHYDFKLSWDYDARPTLSTALQEQLGLKFESQKVPVSDMVIESAQKPTEN